MQHVCGELLAGLSAAGAGWHRRWWMPRPRYLLPPAGIYHVTTRGVDRMPIAHDDLDFRYVDEGIRAACFRFGWTYHAHCVMPNHFHLVVEAALRRLSAGMQWLNWRVARRFNARYDRVGHFVEKRFDAWVIEDDEHFANACPYVWTNAVRAGIVERPEDWPWCGLAYLPRAAALGRRRPRADAAEDAARTTTDEAEPAARPPASDRRRATAEAPPAGVAAGARAPTRPCRRPRLTAPILRRRRRRSARPPPTRTALVRGICQPRCARRNAAAWRIPSVPCRPGHSCEPCG